MQNDYFINLDKLKEPGYLSQVFASERLLAGDIAFANLILNKRLLEVLLNDAELIKKMLKASADPIQYTYAVKPIGGGDGATETLPVGYSPKERLSQWINDNAEKSATIFQEHAKEIVTALLDNNSFITILKYVKPDIYEALLKRLQEGGYAESPEVGSLLTDELRQVEENKVTLTSEGGFKSMPEYYRKLKTDTDRGHFGRFLIHLRQLEKKGKDEIQKVLDFEKEGYPKLLHILYDHFDNKKARNSLFHLLKVQDPELEIIEQDEITLFAISLELGEIKLAKTIATKIANRFDPIALYKYSPLLELAILKAPEAARIIIAEMKPETLAFARFQKGFHEGSTPLIMVMYNVGDELILQIIDKLRGIPGVFATKGRNGYTALMCAAMHSSSVVVEALLKEMSPEEAAIQNDYGSNAIIDVTNHEYFYPSGGKKAMKLIEKMSPEALTLANNKQDTALGNAISLLSFYDNEYLAVDVALKLVEKIPSALISLSRQVNLDSGKKEACILEYIFRGSRPVIEEIGLAITKKVPERIAPYLNQPYQVVTSYTSYHDGKTTFLQQAIDKGYNDLALEFIKIMTPEALGLQPHLIMAMGKRGDSLWNSKVIMPEVAMALIEKMQPKDLAIQNDEGSTALIMAMYILRKDDAQEETMFPLILKMIEKMSPETIATENKEGMTAVEVAIGDHGETPYFKIASAILKKARVQHPPEKLSKILSELQEKVDVYLEKRACWQGMCNLTQELMTEVDPSLKRIAGRRGDVRDKLGFPFPF